jgi:CRP/FNR family transcriptional regulator, cyclic AMP receptor protein
VRVRYSTRLTIFLLVPIRFPDQRLRSSSALPAIGAIAGRPDGESDTTACLLSALEFGRLPIGARFTISFACSVKLLRASDIEQLPTAKGPMLSRHRAVRLTVSVVALARHPIGLCQRRSQMEKPADDKFNAQDFLEKMGVGKAILEFEKNENVFVQGDLAETVYYIQKGKIKVTVVSQQNKEAVVGVLGPGQFFGEGCMNGHRLRIATTTAMDACVVTSITKQAMKAALHNQPAFSELFVAFLLTRNSRIQEDLIDQLFNSSERRLARMLLLLSQFGKEGIPQQISPNVSQETLADMIGTTRSRVSHFMNKFRKLGFITYNGHIEVNSSLLDAVLHDKPELKEDE